MEKAEELAPALVSVAEDISRKFTLAFTLFAECHNLYNSSKKFAETDIILLGK